VCTPGCYYWSNGRLAALPILPAIPPPRDSVSVAHPHSCVTQWGHHMPERAT